MTQKPMLRAEVGMRVRCANKSCAEWFKREKGIGQFPRKIFKKKARNLWVLRTPQNNKEEGARAKKLVKCGTRGPLGREVKVCLSARKALIDLPLSQRRLWRDRNSFLIRGVAVNRKSPPSKMQTTTCKRAACGLAVPPYQRAKP